MPAVAGFLSERDGSALVAVRVRARGGRDAIEGVRGDRLVVRVSAPPVGGRANTALCRMLAKAVGVAPGRATVVVGERSRDKLVRLEGVAVATAAKRLGGP
jgi:uncharacterized protein